MPFRVALGAALLAPLLFWAPVGAQGSKKPPDPPRAAAAPEVARVGDRVITLADVDAAWEKRDPGGHHQLVAQLYEQRRNVLDDLVADALIQQASKAKGMDSAAFVSARLAGRSKPVTEADVEGFYAENKSRMPGQSLDAMREPIRRFLEQQATIAARDALVAELKAERPGAVSITLEAPRVQVSVKPDDPVRGSKAAPVEIVEFSDFQCPFCGRVTPTLKQVMDTYGDRVRLVFKDFPLPNHADAPKAAEAAHCAGEQGKYWEMHDRLFGNQQALGVDALKQHAVAIGLDAATFNACLDADRYRAAIQANVEEGERLGITSTPSLFINGRIVVGAQPFESFKAIIDEELGRVKK